MVAQRSKAERDRQTERERDVIVFQLQPERPKSKKKFTLERVTGRFGFDFTSEKIEYED